MNYNFEKTQEWLFLLAFILIGLFCFIDTDIFFFSMHGYALPLSHLYPKIIWTAIAITIVAMITNTRINLKDTYRLDKEENIFLTTYKNGENKLRIHIGFDFCTTVKILINIYKPIYKIARHRTKIIDDIFQIFILSNCDEMEISSHLINKKTMEILELTAQHHAIEINTHEKTTPRTMQKILFFIFYKKTLHSTRRVTLCR
ncbi:hypothetical protein [Vogesella oryzagri]